MIGETGIDAAPDHVGREQGDIARAARENKLRSALKGGDERMNAHLADDHAFAQGILAEFRPRPVARSAPLRNSLMTISGSSSAPIAATLASCHIEVFENLLCNIQHEIKIAIAASHAAAAEDHGTAELLARFHHMAVVDLHRFAFEVFCAGAEIIRSGVHGAAIGNDGIDTAVKRRVERLFRIAIAKSTACGDNAIDKFRHSLPPF